MSYLGFDRQRLIALRRAMERVASELGAIASTDWRAAEAVRRAHAEARQLYDTWLPVTSRVIDCTALTRPAPLFAPGTVGALAPLGLLARGWAVQADPLTGRPPLTTVEAAAIGAALNDADIAAIAADPVQWAELLGTLRVITADPALLAAFGAVFQRWDGLIDAVARRRRDDLDEHLDTEARRAAHVDDLSTIAAAMQRLDALDGSLADRITTIAETADPWAMATLCTRLQVDSVTLGSVLAAVIRNGRATAGVAQLVLGQPDLAEPILALMHADPRAARLALVTLGDDAADLFTIAHPSVEVGAILRAAIDPSSATPGEAGAVLAVLIDSFEVHWPLVPSADDPHGPTIEALLVGAAAPWLSWFGPRAEQFGWSTEQGAHRIAVLADSRSGQDALIAESERWLSAAGPTVVGTDGQIDVPAIDVIAGTMTLVIETLRRTDIDRAALDRAVADAIGGLVRQLPRLLPLPPGPPKLIGTKVAGAGLDALDHALTRWGVIPPDATMAEAAADQHWAEQIERVAETMFVIAAEGLIAAGKLPAEARDPSLFATTTPHETCPARSTRQAMTTFVHQWVGRYPAAQELYPVRDAMLNEPTVAVACRGTS